MNNDRYSVKVYEERKKFQEVIRDTLAQDYFIFDLDTALSKQGDPSLHDFLAGAEVFVPEGV